jgi:hypothetical protein
MSIDVRDESLLRRFLMGDITADEREQIEDAFMVDDELYQSLRAIEDELIIDYLRGRLTLESQTRFAREIEQSPVRQQRVAQVQQLLDVAAPAAAPVPAARPKPSRWRPITLAAAAVMVLVAGLTWRSPASPPPPDETVTPAAAPSDVVFDVGPVVRSADGAGNTFVVPAGRTTFTLRFPLAVTNEERAAISLRATGGAALALETSPVIEHRRDGLAEVRWTIPVDAVKPGDYEIVVTIDRRDGSAEPWRRSFTLERP